MRQPRWNLTLEAFSQLLKRLGPDAPQAAAGYEDLRRKLIDFFTWRGMSSPETLADETLDRVARKQSEGEDVQDLRAYCHGVAKMVLLEARKRHAQQEQGAAGAPAQDAPGIWVDAERRASCLERCLSRLPPESRELIVGYYRGEGISHLAGRKRLAGDLGISYGTLKTRAHRVRVHLESCLRDCLEGRTGS